MVVRSKLSKKADHPVSTAKGGDAPKAAARRGRPPKCKPAEVFPPAASSDFDTKPPIKNLDEAEPSAEDLAAEAAKPPRELVPTPPPERERGSYDGDTAIKLYLREIGLVKLLTPTGS